jgi:integrase
MIRSDLRRAKAGWIKDARPGEERCGRRVAEFLTTPDHAGKVIDFHALRATCITLLVKGGASVKVVQELARHATATLTLGVYTKLGVYDLNGALDGLPDLSPPDPERGQLRVTETGFSTHPDDCLLTSTRLFP